MLDLLGLWSHPEPFTEHISSRRGFYTTCLRQVPNMSLLKGVNLDF